MPDVDRFELPERVLPSTSRNTWLPSPLEDELWLGKVEREKVIHTFLNEKEAMSWMQSSNPFTLPQHVWRVRLEVQEAFTTVANVDRLEQK